MAARAGLRRLAELTPRRSIMRGAAHLWRRGFSPASIKRTDMDAKPTTTRREFIATTAAAAAAFTIVPRHVLGGPRFVAPSDKVNVAIIGAGGQGRTNTRALFQEDDCQVIALADPADSWDSRLVLRWQGRPRAGGAGNREALQRENAELQVRDVRGLPRHAREGEGDRRGPDRDARPPARVHHDLRDEGGQARLLREAADAQHPRGAARRARHEGDRRRHADGQSAGRAKDIARRWSGSRTAR